MISLGDVYVYLRGDRKGLDRTISDAERDVKGFAGRIGQSLGQSLQFALGGTIERGLANITAWVGNLAATGYNAVASNERLGLSLESLIASQMRAGDATISMTQALAAAGPIAGELAEWINKVAVKSPFEQDDIARSIQMAQGFKFTTTRAKELEQALVDGAAAMGRNGQAIESATRAIGQMNVKGKTSQEELNQLGEAGFDYVRVLDKMGVGLDDVAKGTVRADEFISTFIQTLQGDFAGAAERQATSWAGLASTFSDIVKIGMREFLEGILDRAKPLAVAFTDTFSNPEFVRGVRELGQAIGELLTPAIEWLTEKVNGLPAAFGRAADFIRQLRDELSGITAGEILAGIGPAIEQMQGQLAGALDTLAKAHKGMLANLQADITEAGTKLNEELVKVSEKYGPKIADIQDRFAKSIRSAQESIDDAAEAHGKRRTAIEKSIVDTSAKLEEKLTQLKTDHLKRRNQLVTSLLTAESEEQYLNIQEQIKAEDGRFKEESDKAKKQGDEQRTELQARLDEEEAAYNKQSERLRRSLEEQKAERQKAIGEIEAEQEEEATKVREKYNQHVDALRARIEAENQAYEQQSADLRASFEQQIADFRAISQARAEALGTGPAADLAEKIRAALGLWDQVSTKAGEFSDWITGTAIPALVEWGKSFVMPGLEATLGFLNDLFTRASDLAILQGLVDTFIHAGESVTRLNEAMDRLLQGLGLAWPQVDGINVVLAVFNGLVDAALAPLDGVLFIVEALTGAFNGWSGAISSWSKIFQGDFAGALEEVDKALPDWLRPGSPTPFQRGIEGISTALEDMRPKLNATFNLKKEIQAAGGTNVTLSQTNNLPQAPAGFDSGSLLEQIRQQTLGLLMQAAEGQ